MLSPYTFNHNIIIIVNGVKCLQGENISWLAEVDKGKLEHIRAASEVRDHWLHNLPNRELTEKELEVIQVTHSWLESVQDFVTDACTEASNLMNVVPAMFE